MTRQNIIFRGILFTTLFSFIFTSCDWLFSSTEQTVTADQVISWKYDEDKPWVEIDPSVIQISISNLPVGNRLYISKTNPTDSLISYEYTQCVYAVNGITPDTTGESLDNYISTTRSVADTTETSETSGWHCFIPEDVELPVISSRSVSATVGTGDNAQDEDCTSAGYVVGSEAYFYIDTANNSGNPTNYQLAKCYLRAKGTYCNVWVVDGYYWSDLGTKYYYKWDEDENEIIASDNSYNVETVNKITASFVLEAQKKFDTMYVPITSVFGTPSDQIYSWDHEAYVPLSYYDDTWSEDYEIKDPVNIIIYDIGKDKNNGGILGYFWGKDYFTNPTNHVDESLKSEFPANSTLWYSNEGKFFYIDSYYANTDEDEVISTLAHEFQHMIEYNEKTIKHGLSYGSAHKEMKSMICEDLMKDLLDNMRSSSSSSITGPVTRLPHFAGSYLYNGVEEYSDYYTILSYAEAYAFGAFLIRNYGGVDFVKALCTNDKVEMEGIIAAIKTATGKTVTKADIMRDFALACTNENYDVSAYPRFYTIDEDTHNGKTVTSTGVSYYDYYYDVSSQTYYYPISPIDIFDMTDQNGGSSELSVMQGADSSDSAYYTLSYNGPIKYLPGIRAYLRPYGIMLQSLGTTKSTDAIIYFKNDTINKNQHLYLIVDNGDDL